MTIMDRKKINKKKKSMRWPTPSMHIDIHKICGHRIMSTWVCEKKGRKKQKERKKLSRIRTEWGDLLLKRRLFIGEAF